MDGVIRTKRIVAIGAEAILYRATWINREVIIKKRVKKSYRNPRLDNSIRKERTRKEASLISRSRSFGVPTPIVFDVDLVDCTIVMEYIPGTTLKEEADKVGQEARQYFYLLGENIGKLHGNNVAHGDLTTSNLLVYNGHIYIIDFGLAEITSSIEDFAVDLHLFETSIRNTHGAKAEDLIQEAYEAYSSCFDNALEVFKRKKEVEKRGRYKTR